MIDRLSEIEAAEAESKRPWAALQAVPQEAHEEFRRRFEAWVVADRRHCELKARWISRRASKRNNQNPPPPDSFHKAP